VTVQKTAVLVIRVWWDEGLDGNALRARITRTLDVSDADALETAAASEDEEIVAAVSAWLCSFRAAR
jgi:hypothetical protein